MKKERKKFQAPRSIIKWLEKLNLNYKVSNFRRDLSNGYIIASILNKYDQNLEMNYFYNNFKLDRKFHN